MRLIISLALVLAATLISAAPVYKYSLVTYAPHHLQVSEEEFNCLSKNIYFEASTQDEYGKYAVANATLNRVRDPLFPNSICGVVFQPSRIPKKRHLCQFSWHCDGKPDRIRDKKIYKECQRIAALALLHKDKDITDGATHYHADYVKPWWAKKLKKTVKIGAHIFYKGS